MINELKQKTGNKWIIMFLVVITFLVYANSLKNAFVWDDHFVIADNNFIKSLKNLPAIFSKGYLGGSGEISYRPVVTLSYFIDYRLWKLNPSGYHLTNILLHAANVILLFFLANSLVKSRYTAMMVSLIFALHPVNSEAVNVISFREELLAFFFSAGSLLFFIRHYGFTGLRRFQSLFISSVLYLFALFSKESAVFLPVICLFYDYFFVSGQSWKKSLTSSLQKYGLYFFTFIAYSAAWLYLRGGIGGLFSQYPYPGGSFYTSFLTMAKVIAVYIFWLILPLNIHATLPENQPALSAYTLFSMDVFFSIILIVALLALAFFMRKRSPVASFSIIWFFTMLIPVSNLIPISCIIASRYLYLPMAGFCFVFAKAVSKAYALKGPGIPGYFLKRSVIYLCVLILLFYSVTTVFRNLAWKNDIIVWGELVKYYPRYSDAHLNLGISLNKAGLIKPAVKEYETAIELWPNNYRAHNEYGALYVRMSRYDDAIVCFKKALELNPEYLSAYNNLAVAYAGLNRWDEARAAWLEALKIDPSYQEARRNLEILKDQNE